MLTHLNSGTKKPDRVLLLGRSGFLASHFHRRLSAEKIPVIALGSSEIDLTADGAGRSLAKEIRKTDAVVVLAAITSDRGSDTESLMLNLRMGKAVCEAVNHSPCAHLVYVSSDAVYDAHQIPLDEESTREPVSLYALMHTAREMMIGTSVAKESIPFCILRPTSIYGSGDSHRNYGPNQFVRSAVAEGRIVLFGNGEERRSHVYIDDAIEVLLQCVLHRSSGTLNLAEARAISYRNLADLISGFCPHPVAIDHASRRVPTIHRRYKPTQVFRFLYNLGRPIGPIVHRTFVVSALRHAFPEFEPTPIAAGIERFLEETLRARAKTPEERS